MSYIDDGILIRWAEELLHRDFYSDAIANLAGYNVEQAKLDREDFISTFEQAVVDLNLKIPPNKEVYEEYGAYLCEGILEGFINPEEGHQALYELWSTCNYQHDTPDSEPFEGFMYLDDSMGLLDEGYGPLLDRLEGLSVETYPDFLKQECKLYLDRTN